MARATDMTGGCRPLLIGEFAHRCRLPVSTLRYYDKIGLLVPALVDPVSGYRRYTTDQLSTAVLIARLRTIGTAPHDIAQVLAGGASATAVLAAERRRLEDQISERRRALSEIDDLLSQPDDQPTGAVEWVHLGCEKVAAVPFGGRHADLESTVLRGIAALRSMFRRVGLDRTGPWSATFPLEITDEVHGCVFARVPLPLDDDAAVGTAWLPATMAVRTVHHGGPATVALSYRAAFEAIDRRGLTPTGPVIEEYLSLDGSPATTSIRLSVPAAG